MRHRLLLVAVVTVLTAGSADAGLFKRAAKPDPAVHVPNLVRSLKAHPEDRVRRQAASELRDYDAKAFPDILPALIDALKHDASPHVRSEAAESIGKVRPISPQAGFALEQAKENDKAIIVRVASRTALLQYRVVGYFTGDKGDGMMVQSAEPPLAVEVAGRAMPAETVLRPTPSPVPVDKPVRAPKNSQVEGPALPVAKTETPPPQTFEPPLASPPVPTPVTSGKPPVPVVAIPPSLPEPRIVPASDTTKPTSVGPALPPLKRD